MLTRCIARPLEVTCSGEIITEGACGASREDVEAVCSVV